MIRRSRIFGFAIVLLAMTLALALAMDTKCTQCGMMVNMDSPFTSKITQRDTTLYFCDIGDLFAYLRKMDPKDARAEVRDYPTRAWLDARKAHYVHGAKKFSTPMGWGIAAFKDVSVASQSGTALDFDGMAETLK